MIPLTNPSEKSIKSIVDTNQHKWCEQCGKEEIYAKGLCVSCYKKQYYKNNKELYKVQHVRYIEKHPEKKEESLSKFIESINRKELKEAKSLKKQTCKILKEHAKEMQDDPEHLTTEFMQKLIGIKCKKPKKN